MIRVNPQVQSRRRIAVIAIPRPQQTRLGTIRNGDPAGYGPPVAWTTISTEGPESSANFLSSVMARQAAAALKTPGTLVYTPATTAPAENIPPWNSWLQPNCPVPLPNAPSDQTGMGAATTTGTIDFFWIGVGLVTSAAAIAYLFGKKGK